MKQESLGDRAIDHRNIGSGNLILFPISQIIMKFLTATTFLVGLSVALMPTIASAQYNNSGFGNSGDNRDPFNRARLGDTSGLMQLLNQAQLNGRSNPIAIGEQQEQLNSATADFRARQMQALKDRNKKTAPASAVKSK